MTVLEQEVDLVRSFDGTSIATRSMGRGDGVPLLLADAVGTKLTVWRRTLHPLAATRPILNWDLRGSFESGPPASGRLDPAAHARDAEAALDHLHTDTCVVAAWSSGGRIALEIAHAFPERVAGLVLVCAGYGHSLGRLLRLDPVVLLPRIAGVAKHIAPLLHGPFSRFVARPEIAGLVRQSGMVAASADTSALVELLQTVADGDPSILLRTYEAVSGDPGASLLPTISAPALVVTGSNDRFTARSVIDEIVTALDAELKVYEGATHFLPIEFPGRLSSDLQAFLERIDADRAGPR